MDNARALLLTIGLAVAGGALGVLVSFDRAIDEEPKAINAGIAMGVGLAVALVAYLTRDGSS